MRRGQKTILLLSFAGAFATVGFLVVPWFLAAVRGDLWVDTIGYEVSVDPKDPTGSKVVTFSFYGSESGGEGRIAIESVADGEHILFQNPATLLRKYDVQMSAAKRLDAIEATFSLSAIQPLPELLTVK